jgi:hypothetical protein
MPDRRLAVGEAAKRSTRSSFPNPIDSVLTVANDNQDLPGGNFAP